LNPRYEEKGGNPASFGGTEEAKKVHEDPDCLSTGDLIFDNKVRK